MRSHGSRAPLDPERELDESEDEEDLEEAQEDLSTLTEGVASDMLPADAERILAATLALMTSFYRCPHTALCRKLMDNLAMLSRHPDLTEPLRMVCRNAEARWASYLEEVEQAIAEVGELDCADDEETPPTTLH